MERRIRCVAVLACLFINAIALSQDVYYVTLVKGQVTRSNAARVKVGDKLLADEKLKFPSKECRIIMLHPQKGRFVLEATNVTPEATGEYLVYIKSNLNLNSQRLQLSSRGASQAGLDDYFTANEAINENLLLIGDVKISLEPAGYRIADPVYDYFFLQYADEKGKIFRNKLKVSNDTLYIHQNDFSFGGREPISKHKVIPAFSQHSEKGEQVTYFHSFKPVFMTSEACREIMRTVKLVVGEKKEKVISETMTQLYFNYGKPDKEALLEIYESL